MASLKQLEANRRNAQKSTGPRSVEGKAASSQNALKSGIDAKAQTLPGEKPEALEALTAEYYDRFRPATPEARHLVDTLVSNEWLLRRFRRIEVQILKHEMEAAFRLDAKNPEGHAYVRAERSFERLQRRINAAERNYHRALKELSEIGFVPPPVPDTDTEARPSGSAPAVTPFIPQPADTDAPVSQPLPTGPIGFVP